MNSNQQRILIAEACGVKTLPQHDWDERDDRRYFICSNCNAHVIWRDYSTGNGPAKEPCSGTECDYPNCLNAMYLAEQALTETQERAYIEHLYQDMADLKPGLGFALAHLTAQEKAKAFLKTIDKWKEDHQR